MKKLAYVTSSVLAAALAFLLGLRIGVSAADDDQHYLGWAWSIIANAGGGDWTRETPEWQVAAAKWRDRYFGRR